MKRLLFILLLLPCFSFGQNLVPNPSFEDTINCPPSISTGTCPGFFYDAFSDCVPPWYLPTCGTADYYHGCSPANVVGVPNNSFGYQPAKTGTAYGGMIVYDTNAEWREYIATPLIQPLQSGKTYLVEFYVNLSDNWYAATDSIGLYFSTGSIDTTGVNWWALPYTPHVSSPSGNFLSDSIGWTLISGTYVAAGGEDYITIGNFSNDANTAINLPAFKSYYFIDDVSVILIPDSIPPDTTPPDSIPPENPPTPNEPNPANNVWLPNVFSPNGDGENDVLYVRGNNIKELSFVIYDRWGEKVFESGSIEDGWAGKGMNSGVFVYYVKGTFNDDEPFSKKGNVTLVQ